MDVGTIEKLLKEKFDVIHLNVEDDSGRHKRHKQSQGQGGHFKLLIVSNDFEGMNLISRHRKIYEALNMGKVQIHALGIQVFTETEWKVKNVHSS
ncbi:MAG: BolA family transcriptional regulator [Proteobacteria bacterium]|jgi:BolA protein|nr:BolA family transcriptional regulator [Pseudomonadota bacterium]